MSRYGTLALVALLTTGVAGCDEATAPSSEGPAEMRVGVRGDGGSQMSAYRTQNGSGSASGKIDVEARVFIQTDAGAWVELTRGKAQQTVDASGRDGVKLLATAEVAATSYQKVRVEFERVEANLSASIVIGTGSLTGSVRVDGGSDQRVTVERPVNIEARGDSSTQLVIDLNADQWLGRASTSSRTVAEADFRSAVIVTAR